MMILCPAYLLGIWLWEQWHVVWMRHLLPTLLAINVLFLPAQHVLWTSQWPIVWLPGELRNWNAPSTIFAAAESFKRGKALNQQGKFAQAMKCFDDAIRTENNYPQALVERSLLLMRAGNSDKALADLDEAVRLRPEFAHAFMLRGQVHGSRGEMPAAADDLRRLSGWHPRTGRIASKPSSCWRKFNASINR